MKTGIEDVFATHGRALEVHAKRIEMIAGNLANADTPGFKARDLDFQQILAESAGEGRLRLTDERHLSGAGSGAVTGLGDDGGLYRRPTQPSLDGNTVDSNVEKTALAEASVRYESTLTFLTRKISGLKNALQIQ